MQPPTSAWMRISELSRRVGVSTDTLRAWERRYGVLKPRRTQGNTRLYSALDEARIRVMKRYIEQDLPVAQAAELAMAARLALRPGRSDGLPDHEADRARADLQAALDRFDETAAERTLQQLIGAYAATAVLRKVVLPYLAHVGDRWAANHMTVAQEHFASNFMQSRLLGLARGWDRGLGPQAVLAAAPNDHHTLGLICFGIALHGLGWRITYLGAATPVEMVAEAATVTGARLAVLSCSLAGWLDPHLETVQSLCALAPVAIAGPGVSDGLAVRCRALHLDADPISAARLVCIGPPTGPDAEPGDGLGAGRQLQRRGGEREIERPLDDERVRQ